MLSQLGLIYVTIRYNMLMDRLQLCCNCQQHHCTEYKPPEKANAGVQVNSVIIAHLEVEEQIQKIFINKSASAELRAALTGHPQNTPAPEYKIQRQTLQTDTASQESQHQIYLTKESQPIDEVIRWAQIPAAQDISARLKSFSVKVEHIHKAAVESRFSALPSNRPTLISTFIPVVEDHPQEQPIAKTPRESVASSSWLKNCQSGRSTFSRKDARKENRKPCTYKDNRCFGMVLCPAKPSAGSIQMASGDHHHVHDNIYR